MNMELNLEGHFCQLRHLDWIKKNIDSNDGFKAKNTNLDILVDKNTLLDSIPSSDFLL
eukprot:Pgem_evm1s17051